jgi:predicted nucleotidyltransferase
MQIKRYKLFKEESRMNSADQERIDVIKEVILKVIPKTEEMYLYGPYARNTIDRNSEIKIFVVVSDKVKKDLFSLRTMVYEALCDEEYGCEATVSIQHQSAFEGCGIFGLGGIVKKDGIKIYESKSGFGSKKLANIS